MMSDDIDFEKSKIEQIINRGNNKINNITGDIKFQVIDWKAYDKYMEKSNSEDGDDDGDGDGGDDYESKTKKPQKERAYIIRSYGVTKNGESVCATLTGFNPYFFIKVPSDKWDNTRLNLFGSLVKNKLSKTVKYYNEKEIINIAYVKRKEFYGFTNNEEISYIRCVFKTFGMMRAMYDLLKEPILLNGLFTKPYQFKLYESNISPLLRFMHIKNLDTCGWVNLPANKYDMPFDTISKCQIEVTMSWKDIQKYDCLDSAPFTIASFDLECTSCDGGFPEANRPDDKIIQIGTTINLYGETECTYKHIITLKNCDKIDGMCVESYQTERDLLLAWTDFIGRLDPDILTGYNIWGFDFKYLHDRAVYLGCEDAFSRLGRIEGASTRYVEKQLSSSALGDNFLKYYDIEGRVQIDLLKLVQRDHKLTSYKLDNVATIFLGMQKDDLKPKEIFECFKKGSREDIKRIAVYCVKDCELCNKLIIKLDVLTNNIGMANVCIVPLSYIFLRGQGIKIFSLVSKQCREDGFVIPDLSIVKNKNTQGYEGAIVLEPKIGMYFIPISVVDYASLYPSSMISENISHDSIVLDPKYDNLPTHTYTDIPYDIFEGDGDNKVKVGVKTCRFAEEVNGKKAVLPRILEKLLKARKDTRKLFEKEPDPFKGSVLNGLQLAYKVTANSLYGQVGASTSSICMKELAASTTATGRRLLYFAKNHIQDNFPGATCIYGDTDSVFISFEHCKEMINPETGLIYKGKELLQKSIELGQKAGNSVSKCLKAPHDLEYEKTFWPFCLFSKKRYVGNKYEFDANKYKKDYMGIVLKRRDNANIVKEIYGGIIDIILNKHEIDSAKDYFVNAVDKLLKGEVKDDSLIITKSIKATYKNPTQIAHKVLANRMGERDPGNAPCSNDRIPYMYIDSSQFKCEICSKKVNINKCKCIGCGHLYCAQHLNGKAHQCTPCCRYCNEKSTEKCFKCMGVYCKNHILNTTHKCTQITNKLLQGDIIETPEHIRKNNLSIDYRYYLEHQIIKPVIQIFDLANISADGLIKNLIIADNNKKQGFRPINAFFKAV